MEPSTSELITVVTGSIVVPLATDFLLKCSWPKPVKAGVALVVAVAVSTVAYLAMNAVQPGMGLQDWIRVGLLILAGSQVTLRAILKPLGISDWMRENIGQTEREPEPEHLQQGDDPIAPRIWRP